MSQLQEMLTFVQIVERGGIGKASEHLGVAKSAVSRRLSELEKRIGTSLLMRTTRQSSLTEEGERFYQRSLQILGDIEELNASTGDNNAAFAGTLKLAAPPSFGLGQLTEPISQFAKHYPDITFAISLSDRMVDLVRDGFDIAIRIGSKNDIENVDQILCPITSTICASPEYIETHGEPATPQDLKNHHTLQYSSKSHQPISFYGPNNKAIEVSPPIKMRANDGTFLTNAALKGHGIFLAQDFLVAKFINSGALVAILKDYSLEAQYLYVTYPQSRFLAKRVNKFIQHLQQHFGGTTSWV